MLGSNIRAMFSIIIPFHSDYSRLDRTLLFLSNNKNIFKISEVLLCHNGPDWVPSKLDFSKYGTFVKIFHTPIPGLGAGCKIGIPEAQSEYILITGSDLPFGFSDLVAWYNLATKPEVAVGSKGHPKSSLKSYGLLRRTSTYLFWWVRRIALHKNTPRDTQGSVFMRTDIAKSLVSRCHFDSYLFTMELITLAQKAGYSILELPVKLENHEGPSSVSIFKDSFAALQSIWLFSRKIKEKSDDK